MTDDSSPAAPLVGLVRIREHCTFAWRRALPGGEVSVEVRDTHCPRCVAEVRQRGYRLLGPKGEDFSA